MAQPGESAESWRSLGFSQSQQTLDEQSSKIYATQEEGVASRRALSSQTKAFRKLSDDEKLGEMRSLLKNYQTEIDSLTSRAKYAEQCFMNVYKSLALLPDPAPSLESQRAEIATLQAQKSSNSTAFSDEDSRLARELERQTLRVAQLEKQSKERDSQSASGSVAGSATGSRNASPSGPDTTDGLHNRIDDLEASLSTCKQQLSEAQASLKEQTGSAQRYQTSHQQAVNELVAQKDYVDLQKSHADSQREVSRLREAQNDGESPESEDTDGTSNSGSGSAATRRHVKSLEAQIERLVAERDSLQAEQAASKRSISKLEDDLSAVQPSDSFSTVSGWTAVPRTHGPGTAAQGSTFGGGSMLGGGSGSSAVAGITMQQRDRYKKRTQELEERSHHTESALTASKRELESVKRESFRLYDRIRQLQAHAPPTASSSPSGTTSVVPQSYEPTVEQRLKELDIDRRSVNQSAIQVKSLESSARMLVDPKFRIGSAAYVAASHVLVVLGFSF